MRLVLALTVALVVLSPACAATTTPASGVRGVVLRGPTQPVCREGEPCEGPARTTLVFLRNGREATRVRTGADGRFRVALAPGAYAVRTTERVFGRIPHPGPRHRHEGPLGPRHVPDRHRDPLARQRPRSRS